MKIDILGISETFWKCNGGFMYELPNRERFKVIYLGGEKHRKGVRYNTKKNNYVSNFARHISDSLSIFSC